MKWYLLLCVALVLIIVIRVWILPGMQILFMSTHSSSVLRNALISDNFLPEGATFKDSIPSDVDLLLTGWELNRHTPCFFTRQKDTYNQPLFNDSLTNMTWVSANNPSYF